MNAVDGRLEARGGGDELVACLGAVARHFGISFDPGILHSLATGRDGRLPFHQAGPAIEQLGLNYEPGFSRRLPRLEQDYPAILSLEGGGHVVALEKRENDLLVWRPEADKSAWEPLEEVQASCDGRLIKVAGNPDSQRESEAPWHAKGRHHWFWSELRKERREFRPVLLASLIINLLALATPLFTMNVYDRVIPNKAEATLWVLGTGVLLAFLFEFSLRTARANVIDQIGRRLDLRLSQKIFSRLLATPLAERQGNTGALAARVSEYALVREFFGSTTVVLLVDTGFLVLFLAAIAYIAGWLALVPALAMAVMAAAGFVLQRRVVEAARDAQADHGLQQTLLVETVAGSETVKSMAAEGGVTGRWRQLAEIGSASQQHLRQINVTAVSLASSFQQVSTVALIVGGYYLFAAGSISMGAIIAIVMLASRSLAPAGQIAYLLTRWRQAQETLTSIEKLFDASDERRQGSMGMPAVSKASRIVFDHLEFSYPDAPQASLDGLSLTIEPGERVAVIGRVASGKSTLGRVMCGLYQPTGGAMLIDGIDSRQFRPQELREQFRFVGQDANLFTGTVRENLTLGRGAVTEEGLIQALHTTGADQFVGRDASGFDRLVGEHGRRLSGGQRSFVALARAFTTPARLLFLDEPTGAMDSQTEKLFVERLSQSLTPGQTLVISTHRPALFSVCDRLIVLDNGRIAADGPIAEVMAKTPLQGS